MDDLQKPMLCDDGSDNKKSEPIRKLVIVSFLCLFFMIIEIVGGYLANSLAIMSDAAHLLSDISGFLISIFALYISGRPSSQIMSYGYHRAETIGALISISIIWGLVIWLLYEAVFRIIYPEVMDPLIMMITAGIGMGVNIMMALTLHHGHDHSHGGHNHSHDSHSMVNEEHNHDHHDHDHHEHHEHHEHHNHHDHDHHDHQKTKKTKQSKQSRKSAKAKHESTISIDPESTLKNIATETELTLFEQNIEESSELKLHQKHFSEGYQEKIKENPNRTARTSTEGVIIPEFNQLSRVTNKNISNHFIIEVNSVDFQFTSSSGSASCDSEICSNVEKDHENVNVHAALIHIIGDLIQSIGVLIASVILYFFPDWTVIDPACTIMFSILVMFTTVPVAKDCLQILAESVPKHIDLKKLEKDLLKIRGVVEVHSLHVWSIKAKKLALACHILSENPSFVLSEATKLCNDRYGITHSTIQVEQKRDCEYH